MVRPINPKNAVLFAILAIACFYEAWRAASGWNWVPGWAGLVLGGLAMAYACNQPGLLMKKTVGAFSLPGLLLFFPYHLLNGLLMHLVRKGARENAFDEIVPGIFLGRQLLSSDQALFKQTGVQAVLDLTAEFQEVPFLRAARAYRCIPLLDNTAPDQAQLKAGVEWIAEQIRHGPVYVHCAAGHGRSAVFVAAYLISAGLARDVESAWAMVKEKRPGVRLNRSQQESLRRFSSERIDKILSGGSL